MMECKLFELTLVPVSEILLLGSLRSSSFFRGKGGGSSAVKVQSKFCSCHGGLLKASCSTAKKLKQSADWAHQDKLPVGNASSWIVGTDGVISRTSLTDCSILDASEDDYDGIVIDPDRLPFHPNAFSSILQSSLSHWRVKGKKGVWLKLPLERSELVPIAVKEGFKYHHAEREYVMLTYWIPEELCMLPANASHQVGVGGFVVNEKDEVLVVLEKQPTSPACVGLWKIPTGFILESEEIFTGAEREVKEETGIDTEFQEVIVFRHVQHVAFGKSDLFFICMLRPLSTEIKVDDLEILDAKWMPLNEFVQQQLICGDNMFKKIIDICIARLGRRYCGLTPHKVISKFDGKTSTLYYNVVEAEDINSRGSLTKKHKNNKEQ